MMNLTASPAAEIAAVQQRFLQFFAKNDVANIAACYAEDAQMLVANMDAVRGQTLEFKTQELEVHGETAVGVGRCTRRRDDGSTFDRGKYMVVWKRAADGWRIHRDMFSTSMAKTPALAPA